MPIDDPTTIRVYQGNDTHEICDKNQCSKHKNIKLDGNEYIRLKNENGDENTCYKYENYDIRCVSNEEDVDIRGKTLLPKNSKVTIGEDGKLSIKNEEIDSVLKEKRCRAVAVAGENGNSIKCQDTELLKCKINNSSKIVHCHTNDYWNTNNIGFSNIVKKRCQIDNNNIKCYDKEGKTNNQDYYKFKNMDIKNCTVDDDGKLACQD